MIDQATVQHYYRRVISLALLLASLVLLYAVIKLEYEPNTSALGWAVVVLQALFIADILISRRRHRRLERKLKDARNNLAHRVAERTDKLRNINNQLYDEIAKHKVTEELLTQTQEYLHSIINSMPSVLIGVNRDSVVTHWNAAAARATDIPEHEALNRKLHDVFPVAPVSNHAIRDAIDHGIPNLRESLPFGPTEDGRYVDITIYPLNANNLSGAVVRMDDVSMRVRVENMMIQNEKMMSLGELAAGMAHEINNPLSAILNSVQNISRRVSQHLPANQQAATDCNLDMDVLQRYLQQRDIFRFLDNIREAGERSARIVSNMLEFSRINTSKRQLTDVTELLEHSLELAQNAMELQRADGSQEIAISKEFYPDLPMIECSQPELQQVFLNLLINALQSFNQPGADASNSPLITLRTRADSHYVHIEVEDNGAGMTKKVRQHMFEPFFTTKEVGEGTGLGLSISYFIVTEHHGGSIEVESQPGKGSTFIIRLPLTPPSGIELATPDESL